MVLGAGAIGSAVILLRSASEAHSGRYGPALGVLDFHGGERNVSYALGAVRGGGGVLQDPLFAESPPVLSLVSRLLPDGALEWLADRFQ